MVRTDPTAEDSFAAMRERMRFGIAMAAMIKMIATTISNSIREKPFCFFMKSPWIVFDASGHIGPMQGGYHSMAQVTGLPSDLQPIDKRKVRFVLLPLCEYPGGSSSPVAPPI